MYVVSVTEHNSIFSAKQNNEYFYSDVTIAVGTRIKIKLIQDQLWCNIKFSIFINFLLTV